MWYFEINLSKNLIDRNIVRFEMSRYRFTINNFKFRNYFLLLKL
jgi:hypothetical protein